MKKKLTLALALLLMFPMATYADEKQPQGATSTASIGFTVDEETGPVAPVDPTDPTQPLDPEGEGTGNTGPLSIDYVPNLTFGSQKITRRTETVESTNLRPFVQVTDVRGTGKGWELQAGLGEFKNDQGQTLDNARLTMKNGTVKSTDATDPNAPTTPTNIVLTPNGTASVMKAEKDKGMGTWLTTWLAGDGKSSNDKVTLELDTREARVGNYEAEMTWNLILVP